MARWPKDNQEALKVFYGNPGPEVEGRLVAVVPPFRMTYEGQPIKSIKFHEKAAPALRAALDEIWAAYGKDQNKIDAARVSIYDGAYNPRKIEGTDRWSNHAFGAAIDFDAAHNGFNTGHGTMSQIVINAFKRQGARWGGDYHGRTDPMHFEFVDTGVDPATVPVTPSKAQTNIIATVFGGVSDPNKSAYTGKLLNDTDLYVALPYHFADPRPLVWVENVSTHDRAENVPLGDVGPWNIHDPYWETGARPQAEGGIDMRGRNSTSKAGIDLSPALARKIKLPGIEKGPKNAKGPVNWGFMKDLGKPIPAPVQPTDWKDFDIWGWIKSLFGWR